MRQRSWLKKLLIRLTLLMVVMSVAVGSYAWYWLHQPIANLSDNHVYEIARGATSTSIARDLHEQGWLQYPQLWCAWARLQHQTANIKAGEYALHANMTPDELLHLFTSGVVVLHGITFIEGSTFDDMRQVLQQHANIQHTLEKITDAEVMRRLQLVNTHPEGQFFPDTYEFARGTTDMEILSIAQRRMQHELQSAWDSRSIDVPLMSAYEALIMASIIEKESALAADRPKIAGVFFERLRIGMRLQTDPTVIYGMGDSYDGNIRKDDLQRDTPYNTYTRSGLPPTPICLPGAGALQAATHPLRTGALYFMATGQSDGAHYFSRTLEEHNMAIQRYLQTIRAHRNQ